VLEHGKDRGDQLNGPRLDLLETGTRFLKSDGDLQERAKLLEGITRRRKTPDCRGGRKPVGIYVRLVG
jgi:hypothetical protein